MKLENIDEIYSFRGRMRDLVGALKKEGFIVVKRVETFHSEYLIRPGERDNENLPGTIGQIPIREEPRVMIVHYANSNPRLREFARAYKG